MSGMSKTTQKRLAIHGNKAKDNLVKLYPKQAERSMSPRVKSPGLQKSNSRSQRPQKSLMNQSKQMAPGPRSTNQQISGAENPQLIDPSAHEILTNKSEVAALEIALPQLKDDPVSTHAVNDSGTKGKEVGTVETDMVEPTKPTLTKSGIKENIAVNEPRDNGQVKGEVKRRHFIKDQDTSQ